MIEKNIIIIKKWESEMMKMKNTEDVKNLWQCTWMNWRYSAMKVFVSCLLRDNKKFTNQWEIVAVRRGIWNYYFKILQKQVIP